MAAAGGTVINMTGHPEAILARELGLCYTAIALVTDLHAGDEVQVVQELRDGGWVTTEVRVLSRSGERATAATASR